MNNIELSEAVLNNKDTIIGLLKTNKNVYDTIEKLMDKTVKTFENVVKKLDELDDRITKLENN